MDYVLFGMGYGATLMLIGWALRTFGPSLKYKNADDSPDVDAKVKRRFWVRFIQGAGGIIAIAGTALVFITFVVMLVNPDDETGSFTALVVWGFLLVAVLVWCWLYFGRFGLTGVWGKDEGYGLVGSSSKKPRSSSTRSGRTSVSAIENRKPADTPGTAEAASLTSAQQAKESQPVDGDGDDQPTEDTDAATDPTQREYDFGDANASSVFASRTAALRRLRDKQRPATEAAETDVIETSENSDDDGKIGTS